jgi:hypothetical protein
LPLLKRGNAPSVRLVLPGLFWVTLASSASDRRNRSASRFFVELMDHAPPVFQSPPLLTIQIENSACDSSGPSGIA